MNWTLGAGGDYVVGRHCRTGMSDVWRGIEAGEYGSDHAPALCLRPCLAPDRRLNAGLFTLRL